jgi:ATP-dependent Clp protease protease subunit
MSQNNQPIRCFEGSAKPYEPFWKFTNEANADGAELELYGVISEYSWMGDEISPKKFKDDLYSFGKGGPITLKINSPGGDVIAASVMRSIMYEYPGEITTRIDGMAASAAVIVAMSGKKVHIMDSAYMMIHDPSVTVLFASLDIEMLGALRDDLKSIKAGIVQTYASKTGLSEDKLSKMMADETWMSAREAVDLRFADEVITGGQKPANKFSNVAFVNALQNYVNVPQALLQRAESVEAEPGPETSDQVEAKPDAHKVEALRNYLKVYVQK